jgi:alpha-ketoglutarate-dependent taurine dioxygenase
MDWVTVETLAPSRLPLIVKPIHDGINLVEWVRSNRGWVDQRLLDHGGLLFWNFPALSNSRFEEVLGAISGELIDYSYRSTPRTKVSGHVYTSTEYPADQSIPLHNENAYSREWPMKIAFLCRRPAQRGGETPIADSRLIYRKIPACVRERFESRKILYVRNYNGELDLSWQTTFQTDDPSQVEKRCKSAGIEFEWRSDKHLRTKQLCPASYMHPVTGEMVWFNQAHLFHQAALPPLVRQALVEQFRPEDFPRNACYGDGAPIEDSVIQEINAIYETHSVACSWRIGDLLVLDNMLVAHGRRPYIGPRQILVAMGDERRMR